MKILKALLHCLFLLLTCKALLLAQGSNYTIQVASVPTEAEAKARVAELRTAGIQAYYLRAEVPGKGLRYRVRFGRFSNARDAKAQAVQAASRRLISEYIVSAYESPLEGAAPRRDVRPLEEKATPPAKNPLLDKPPLDKLKYAKQNADGKELLAKEAGKRPVPPAASKPPEASKASEASKSKEESPKPGAPKPETVKIKEEAAAKTPVAPERANSTAPAVAKVEKPESKRSEPTGATPPPVVGKTPASTPPVRERVAEAAPAVAAEPPKPVRTEPEKTAAPAPPAAAAVTANTAAKTTLPHPEAAESDKFNPASRIAQPPIADALAELDISNRSWKVVRRSNTSDKNLRAIHFVDAMTGWAAGDAGAVYRTTDGGKSWKPLLSGVSANVNYIYFLNWNTGWMLGEMSRKDDGEAETVLLSTVNGGRSWKRQPLPNVQGLFFTDAQNGWAVGRNATLLRTTDGGNEWKPYDGLEKLIGLPVESSNYNFGFRDVYFIDAQNGWLIGNFYGRAKSHIGGLFVTNDGGKTWNRVPLTIQTQYSSGRFTPGLLHSVRFTTAQAGTVTGEMYDGEGRFFFTLHTRDGGKRWEQYRTPSRATHSTQFLDPVTGWTAASAPREGGADAVVYDTTLMRTDNGGASWHNDFVARGNRIRGVFFLSVNKGWAVGDRGMILRYEERSKVN